MLRFKAGVNMNLGVILGSFKRLWNTTRQLNEPERAPQVGGQLFGVHLPYKAINGMAPKYISDLITIKAESSHSLRSNNELLLAHPRVRTKTALGDRAFCAAVLKLWNSLPQSLRKITSVDSFKAQL